MPVIRAALSGPAFAPPTLDQVRRERLARTPQFAQIMLAAEARRRGREYRAPMRCDAVAHAAVKATAETFRAAVCDVAPWPPGQRGDAESGQCPVCNTTLMRVAGKSYGGGGAS